VKGGGSKGGRNLGSSGPGRGGRSGSREGSEAAQEAPAAETASMHAAILGGEPRPEPTRQGEAATRVTVRDTKLRARNRRKLPLGEF
jgi:hypothetical protein